MTSVDLFMELVGTYRKYGWELRSVLLRPATKAVLDQLLEDVPVKEALVDALWFSRPSHNHREAWELRLLGQTQYALFETFEPEETEAEREEMRGEMEARMRAYVLGE